MSSVATGSISLGEGATLFGNQSGSNTRLGIRGNANMIGAPSSFRPGTCGDRSTHASAKVLPANILSNRLRKKAGNADPLRSNVNTMLANQSDVPAVAFPNRFGSISDANTKKRAAQAFTSSNSGR